MAIQRERQKPSKHIKPGNEQIVFAIALKPYEQRKHAIATANKRSDPLGQMAAARKLFSREACGTTDARSFKQFKEAFFRAVQNHCVARAALGLGVAVSDNCQKEFWTADFIT